MKFYSVSWIFQFDLLFFWHTFFELKQVSRNSKRSFFDLLFVLPSSWHPLMYSKCDDMQMYTIKSQSLFVCLFRFSDIFDFPSRFSLDVKMHEQILSIILECQCLVILGISELFTTVFLFTKTHSQQKYIPMRL